MILQTIKDTIAQKSSQYKTYIVFAAITVLVGASCWWGGYYAHKPETITQIQTVTIHDQVDHQVVVTDHSTTDTTITKPDGTVEHTTTHNNIETNSTTHQTTDTNAVSQSQVKETAVPQPKYSVGAQAQIDPSNPLKPSYNATIGYRILGNAWIDALYNTGHKEAAIGFSIKF